MVRSRTRVDAGAAERRGLPVRDPSGLRGVSSNGSTSMGSVWRVDAVAAETPVPLKAPVARYRDGMVSE